MPTPHIEAEVGQIAKTVIMPGDPLRAKFIAENFLTDYKLVNKVRNNYAYTGYYKDKLITVMASGMGMPSIGIYSYELYNFYGVEEIIRIGTAGAYTDKLNLFDLVLVDSCYSESSYAKTQNGCLDDVMYSSKELNEKINNAANLNNLKLNLSKIHSSDVFYETNNNFSELYNNKNCVCVEMESFALFHNAKVLNKKAACILTITDNLVTNQKLAAEERQTALKNMIKIALDTITLS